MSEAHVDDSTQNGIDYELHSPDSPNGAVEAVAGNHDPADLAALATKLGRQVVFEGGSYFPPAAYLSGSDAGSPEAPGLGRHVEDALDPTDTLVQ